MDPLIIGNKLVQLTKSQMSVEEVIKEIDKLKCGKSLGPDGIYPKKHKLKIVDLLSLLYNILLKTASAPKEGGKTM